MAEDENLLAAARVYVSRRGLRLGKPPGSGIDGTVWQVKSQMNPYDTPLRRVGVLWTPRTRQRSAVATSQRVTRTGT